MTFLACRRRGHKWRNPIDPNHYWLQHCHRLWCTATRPDPTLPTWIQHTLSREGQQ